MWSLAPTFFEEQGALVSDLPELDSEDAELWATESSPPLSIASSVSGVANQSLAAAERFDRIHKLEGKYPGWLLLKAVLAEAHYLLFDRAGAQQRLQTVQAAIGRGKDKLLDRAVLELSAMEEAEDDDEDEDDEDDEDVEGVMIYTRPQPFAPFPCSWDTEEIKQRWRSLPDASEFERYSAVTSNILEGVFLLDDGCVARLIKRGFNADSIELVPTSSRIQNKDEIVRVLENTIWCLKSLTKDPTLDESRLQALHRRIMEGNNLNREIDEDGQDFACLLPCGSYRRVPSYTTNGDLETRFCPWRSIAEEMRWFFEYAQLAMADDSRDPFLVSAWLHFAFVEIHPFADGNGRVGRIISSVPLVKAGLPPIVVHHRGKESYFATLIEARQSGDLLPLASFLKKEVELGIECLSNFRF